ncbi:hypothetical protein K438DRAFT_1835765 [Mycena galopus ATCC 62051]|nr:hypothetical protein K438DRAFT_1835765 [Mycena galopus ATCC 62051]
MTRLALRDACLLKLFAASIHPASVDTPSPSVSFSCALCHLINEPSLHAWAFPPPSCVFLSPQLLPASKLLKQASPQ